MCANCTSDVGDPNLSYPFYKVVQKEERKIGITYNSYGLRRPEQGPNCFRFTVTGPV